VNDTSSYLMITGCRYLGDRSERASMALTADGLEVTVGWLFRPEELIEIPWTQIHSVAIGDAAGGSSLATDVRLPLLSAAGLGYRDSFLMARTGAARHVVHVPVPLQQLRALVARLVPRALTALPAAS
jgi:hypothetical protein